MSQCAFTNTLPFRSRFGVRRRLARFVALAIVLTVAPPAVARPSQAFARNAINELVVKGRAPKTGYSRAEFGHAWADADHNGCDTRNDILRRDLSWTTAKPGTRNCVILTGTLVDPYSGETIAFARGANSANVQIDHVVALSNAWQTGAFQWSEEKRQRFANDPLNLLAVQGRLNSQKGDGDAATWLPPRKAFRCAYIARQVTVKLRYQLWVTAPERAAMARILDTCPAQILL